MELDPNSGDEDGLYVGQDGTKSREGMAGRTEGLRTATINEQEIFYAPLGEPDMRDLPSFAHQIAQGMVCAAYSNDINFGSVHICMCS